jgi:hypothetical protein
METKLSSYRRKDNRCEARLVEYGKQAGEFKRRSWRCDQVLDHDGEHVTHSGHRRWKGGRGDTYNVGDSIGEVVNALSECLTLAGMEWKTRVPYWEALIKHHSG